ncbi:acetate kinase [Betaproteobacteria bacterium]|nr:acetate kinase [Betaproteobacteria bacterium]GHU01313.1 acetate kinase [Betaproteobacteria bacterium]GHU01749.1 acetate kinase [Betaproteobacteria bacterium]GHU10636.1 acetate kinase [Betaproteobacteria bacterium]GHU17290.1 acetate kinase [Betaproteobacteria bacterium]
MKSILTINAGSSSIKFALFPLTGKKLADDAVISGQIDGIGTPTALLVAKNKAGEKIANGNLPVANPDHKLAFDHLLSWFTAQASDWKIVAVGNRVVHGGQLYSKPVRLEADTLEQLAEFIPLAPLHQPHNLAGIYAIRALMPNTPQVGCFDTAFHRTQPEEAQIFGLPRQYTAEGVLRYGFHGLSYEYISRVLPEHSPRAEGRVVIAHLGNGASMAAMVDRRGVATTMGFTPVEGLVMGTRVGSIDPGVLLYLMENKGMDVKEITKLLYKESGLLGVSGISQDMRTLLASDKPEAHQAVDLFCYRIARELGSMAAAAGGLDALVFTGGIGEHAPEIRRRVAILSAWLGIKLAPEANARHDLRISAPDSNVDVLVIPTNEEWMIAHHTQTLLNL